MLDTDLIRCRRMQLGLSQRSLARHLGVTSAVVARLENNTNHHALTLGHLDRLAEILAVSPADLLARQPNEPAPDDLDQPRRLGALLAQADAPVARTTLADLLHLTLDALEVRLAALDATLDPAGLRLHDAPDGLHLVTAATPVDDAQLGRLLQAQQAVHGLHATDAAVLARATAGTLDPARLGASELIAVARLTNAGMLDDDLHLTDDVAYSLGLR